MPQIFLYGGNYSLGSLDYYLAVLKDISMYLKGLPGRRNLTWVSGKFPLVFFPPNTLEEIERVKRELDMMTGDQIAIYPVDARGVSLNPTVNKFDYPAEDEIARTTGALAFYSTNDLAEALAKATDDGGSYYTLSSSRVRSQCGAACRRIAGCWENNLPRGT